MNAKKINRQTLEALADRATTTAQAGLNVLEQLEALTATMLEKIIKLQQANNSGHPTEINNLHQLAAVSRNLCRDTANFIYYECEEIHNARLTDVYAKIKNN